MNHDGIVNSQDLAVVSSSWLETGTGLAGDANGDGIVNSQDLAVVSSNWLATSGGGSANGDALSPEPASLSLAVVCFAVFAGALALRRRAYRVIASSNLG